MKHRQEEWRDLCRQAVVEQDLEKLLQLTHRIVELLDEEERVRGAHVSSGPVFQIAYDEMLLMTRRELLRRRGYDVTSVLGNDEAKRVLDKSQSYRIFMVGHAAPAETREHMVRWLKENFPDTKVLALNPPYLAHLNGADFNVRLNGPDEWLAAVEGAAI